MADTTAPILLRTLPADNATGIAVTTNLGLMFDEAVRAGTGSIHIYKADGTLFRSIAAGDASQVTIDSTGTRVIVNPTVDLPGGTSYYVIVEPGAFEDLAGNDFAGISSATSFNFSTAGGATTDTTAPLLTGTTPADNAANVAVGANLVLTFNEAVKAGSGNIEIRNAANGSLVQSIAVTDASKATFSGNQLTINPGSDLSPGANYYVTFASGVVLDLAGNAYVGVLSPTAFNFSTVAGPAPSGPPVLMSSIPTDNGTGAQPWSDIALFFNEEVKPGSGNIEIHKADGSLVTSIPITDTVQVSFADHVVTLNPHADLDWSTGYYVTFAAGVIRDLQNNPDAGVTSSTQLNFTTGPNNADPGPTLVSASPADNTTNVDVGSNIVLTFNEPIKLGNPDGTIRIYYADGTFAKFIYLGDTSQVSISGNTLTVDPTTDLLSQTAYYATLAGGNIADLAGNGFLGITSPTTLNFVTGVSTDASAPLLSSTLPADDTVNVARQSTLILYFNEGVKEGIGNVEIHRASDGSLVQAIAITDPSRITFYDNRILVFPTVAQDWNTEYYVTMAPGVIQDYVGNTFAGISSATAFTFTTMADPAISPPILIASWPEEGNTGWPIDGHVSLIFSEAVQAGTGSLEIRRVSDGALATSININDASQVTISGQQVRIEPNINFDPYTEYYIVVADGVIRDLSGNHYAGISSATELTFTTGDLIPPPPPPFSGGVVVTNASFGPDTTAPSLTAILPVDNATNVPIEGNLTLTFNEAVRAGAGNLQIRKAADGSLFKSIALDDTSQVQFSGDTITINPNVNLGLSTGYYIVLESGAVQDLAGNNYAGFSSPAAFNFTTSLSADTTAPTLTWFFPSDGLEVGWNVNIGIQFNEPILVGSGNIEIRRLLDGTLFNSIPVTDASQVFVSGNEVGINPNMDFDDSAAYYITFGAGVFKDLAGNSHGGTTTSYFTTADQNAPALLSKSPGADATNVTVGSNIVLTFDEPVQPGWYDFSLRVGGQVKFSFDVNDTSQVTYSGNTVTINPNVDLEFATNYVFDIATNAVKDLNGNGFFGASFNFTTASVSSGLVLTGNSLSNTLVGGAGDDVITGAGGRDALTGGGGSDKFVYNAVAESTSRSYDTITDFNASADLFDLWFQVTGVDAAVASGSLSSRGFDSALATAVGAAKLGAYHAVLFTPNAGTLAGKTFLIVDANGAAGYQASADLVVLLGAASSLGGLTASDFV